MATTSALEKRLRVAGMLVIIGLLVEGICLLWAGPLAFILLVAVGGFLCAAGRWVFVGRPSTALQRASGPRRRCPAQPRLTCRSAAPMTGCP